MTSLTTSAGRLGAFALLLCVAEPGPAGVRSRAGVPAAQDCLAPPVPFEQVREAMMQHGDYSLIATMNMALFTAETILAIARAQLALNPSGDRVTVRQVDWYRAYLEVARATPEEAPIGVRMAYQYNQDTELEFRPVRVLDSVMGRRPELAVAVRVTWTGEPDKYRYHDRQSIPEVKVTINRVVKYYLLDFGDMIVYHKMSGVSAHPTSGALGVLFAVIGDARAEDTRIGVSHDNIQVAVVRGSKWGVPRTVVASVLPDGSGDGGTPKGRKDLADLAARLKQDINIRYARPLC